MNGAIATQTNSGQTQVPTIYIGSKIIQGFSFRRLVGGYTGKICTLWNGTAFADFSLNGDYVDVAAIQSFFNGNTGRIYEWFCQKTSNNLIAKNTNKNSWVAIGIDSNNEIYLQSNDTHGKLQLKNNGFSGDTLSCLITKDDTTNGVVLSATSGSPFIGAVQTANGKTTNLGIPSMFINNVPVQDTQAILKSHLNTDFKILEYRGLDTQNLSSNFGIDSHNNHTWRFKGKYKEIINTITADAPTVTPNQINYYNL